MAWAQGQWGWGGRSLKVDMARLSDFSIEYRYLDVLCGISTYFIVGKK